MSSYFWETFDFSAVSAVRGDQGNQGALKHGRGNGYCAPDLCVMRVPPAFRNSNSKNLKHIAFCLKRFSVKSGKFG